MPGDACPTCGARMALDQRYCLSCGNRRGDPRLPFMDAVVFMETSKQPAAAAAGAAAAPPPPAAKSGISPSTTLIAGIATLVLAVGVGVLIGRSGDNSSAPVANQQPQIIRVGGSEGSGGGEEAETATANNAGKEAGKGGGKAKGSGKKAEKAPEKEVGSSGTSKAAEEVLKPSGDVKLPPPTTKVGGECEKGTAGCSDSGEFNGSFFE